MSDQPKLDPSAIVAEREVRFDPHPDEGTDPQPIRFRIGRPVQHAEAWVCPFEIDAFGELRAESAQGADSVQALLLALAKLRIILSALALERRGRLEFAGRLGPGLPSLFEEPLAETNPGDR